MTRPVHYRSDSSRFTACGILLHLVYASVSPKRVTARCCRTIIAAPRPSTPSTARASAVKPVERRATVGGGETAPGCSFCGNHEGDGCCTKLCHGVGGLEICNVCVGNCARICGFDLRASDYRLEDPPCTECTAIDRCSHPEQRRKGCPPVGYVAPFGEDPRSRCARLEKLLGDLERLVSHGDGDFARIATDTNDGGTTDWWFECHKCGESIEGTWNLGDDEANGNVFRCSCGQEFIGSTHIMLHAIEAARRELP